MNENIENQNYQPKEDLHKLSDFILSLPAFRGEENERFKLLLKNWIFDDKGFERPGTQERLQRIFDLDQSVKKASSESIKTENLQTFKEAIDNFKELLSMTDASRIKKL